VKPLPLTPPLLRTAKRVIWFKPPEDALKDPIELLAYAMQQGADEDMAVLLEQVGIDGLRQAIDAAPPGILDKRSWSFWNAKIGRYPAPPMPRRRLEEINPPETCSPADKLHSA